MTHGEDCIARCRALALHTEEPGWITRTFLSEPMRCVHADLGVWMRECGMSVKVDAAGNLRGSYSGRHQTRPLSSSVRIWIPCRTPERSTEFSELFWESS